MCGRSWEWSGGRRARDKRGEKGRADFALVHTKAVFFSPRLPSKERGMRGKPPKDGGGREKKEKKRKQAGGDYQFHIAAIYRPFRPRRKKNKQERKKQRRFFVFFVSGGAERGKKGKSGSCLSLSSNLPGRSSERGRKGKKKNHRDAEIAESPIKGKRGGGEPSIFSYSQLTLQIHQPGTEEKKGPTSRAPGRKEKRKKKSTATPAL